MSFQQIGRGVDESWPSVVRNPAEADRLRREGIRRDAIRIAEGLVHSAVQSSPGAQKSPVDLAQELVDAAEILENAILQNTPNDKTSQSLSSAQNAALRQEYDF